MKTCFQCGIKIKYGEDLNEIIQIMPLSGPTRFRAKWKGDNGDFLYSPVLAWGLKVQHFTDANHVTGVVPLIAFRKFYAEYQMDDPTEDSNYAGFEEET